MCGIAGLVNVQGHRVPDIDTHLVAMNALIKHRGPDETGARPAFEAAMQVIRALGVKLVEVKLPVFPYGPLISTIIGAEGSACAVPRPS